MHNHYMKYENCSTLEPVQSDTPSVSDCTGCWNFSQQKYFGSIIFCRMTVDVGELRCRIAQVSLYMYMLFFYDVFKGVDI